jgi:enamine deaminase RidA (YjgF/YER057c/UK114 family)
VLVVDHNEEKLHIFGEEQDRALGADTVKPACTLIPVPRLALDGMLFEIEAVAALPA